MNGSGESIEETREQISTEVSKIQKRKLTYRISPIISRGFLQKNAIAKRGVRLTFEMRLTFEVFVKIVDRES